ncbi:hypothetical protein IJG11_01290 [Candidatus Saccharibacteria bacterium]|nr:hypothetical protein [Candidatus Saccharibacteria bacterium]
MDSETIAKNKQNSSSVAETNGTTTRTAPPPRPGSDTATDGNSSEMPAMSGEMGEMPEMNCEESEDGETNCEPPEMPEGMEGFEGGPMGDGNFPGEMLQQTTTSNDSILHPVAYLSLGAGSVILSTVMMYTCFSNFFHKKPAATFDKWQKFMWFVIATVVLSAAIITLCYFIPIWVG